MSHYCKNDRVIWQEMGAIKKWAKKSVKPSNNNYQPLRGAGNQKAAHIKGQRTNGRLCRQASRPRKAREQQANFWTYMEGRHAQGPSLTSLYPANTVHSEVMGQR